MHKYIRNLKLFANFLRFLKKVGLLFSEILNCETIQLSIIAKIFIKLINYLCAKFYTNMSRNIMNASQMFLYLVFNTQNKIILP